MSVYRERFQGRTAVITGGASGVGLDVAMRLRAEGARVALWDRDAAALSRACAVLPDGHAVALDVTDADAVAAAARSTRDLFGHIDILITAAGITGPNATVASYPIEEWRRVLEVNLTGTFLCCRSIVPFMQESDYGRVIAISSISGKEGNPNASAYSASKAGVLALVKALGKELARTHVRVNAVAPAAFRSPLLQQMTAEHVQYMLSKIPMGRFGEPAEISALICWLASDEATFTTGAVFDASGGRATY